MLGASLAGQKKYAEAEPPLRACPKLIFSACKTP
jgi:hypothetical protein